MLIQHCNRKQLFTAIIGLAAPFLVVPAHAQQPFGGRPRYVVPTPIMMENVPSGGIGGASLTGDGLTLFYDEGSSVLKIGSVSRSSIDDDWGTGVTLEGAINSQGRNFTPDVSDDGLELYFVRGDTSNSLNASHVDNRLMVSKRPSTSEPWGEAVELPATVNQLTCVDSPTITGDGLELYFNAFDEERIRDDGVCRGRYADTYVSKRPTQDGEWGEPELVERRAWVPGISSDGLRLYFSEGDRGEIGLPEGELGDRPSMFVKSRTSRDEEFGEPVLLGNPPNSASLYRWHSSPREFADGEALFFFAEGGTAPADVWIWETTPAERCDINSDGLCDTDDLTRRSLFRRDLVQGSERESDILLYDISGDGVLSSDDLSSWLSHAGRTNGFDSAYLAGDTNLDSVVDFPDFLALSAGFGGSGRDWSDGNFNGDGEVDFSDFLALSANFGSTLAASEAAAVPEPNSALLLLLGLVISMRCRRRTSRF